MDVGTSHPEVVVVGSLNMDDVVPVAQLPGPGETLLGGEVHESVGGKGANQAIAAARLGRTVACVGLVGADSAGAAIRGRLRDEGVAVEAIGTDGHARTGKAYVFVESAGENTIVVSPGANGLLGAEQVYAAREMLSRASAVIVQMEIPDEAIAEAIRLAGGTVILNPAPARPVPAKILRQVDVLVPNRSELGVLTGEDEPHTVARAGELALRVTDPGAVAVTLGERGALLIRDGAPVHVPAAEVPVVDSTGAGDTFCGALADALVRGEDLPAAVEWAVRASAYAVSAVGAQSAMPFRAQLCEPRTRASCA
ncbi:ribokinase [Haloechinothrix sp. YIM 98757]|uniref:Ribokinase n=1 Tax=Haloechinothrix aidingensis TaxID=2752311 RepID=A0A838AEU1_9PSEU|nr:ribokinase [Haloechinothrix aidingensis]MBA0127677.1 ribokinase [Haloechinothrix aidingensis]